MATSPPTFDCTVQSNLSLIMWVGANWDAITLGLIAIASAVIAVSAILCRLLPPPKDPNNFYGRVRHLLDELAQNRGWAQNSWVHRAQDFGIIGQPDPAQPDATAAPPVPPAPPAAPAV